MMTDAEEFATQYQNLMIDIDRCLAGKSMQVAATALAAVVAKLLFITSTKEDRDHNLKEFIREVQLALELTDEAKRQDPNGFRWEEGSHRRDESH
jgi:hypothetical protein